MTEREQLRRPAPKDREQEVVDVDAPAKQGERIKEELEAQRGVRASINAGFSRVFLTLLDTHVAALISAAFRPFSVLRRPSAYRIRASDASESSTARP